MYGTLFFAAGLSLTLTSPAVTERPGGVTEYSFNRADRGSLCFTGQPFIELRGLVAEVNTPHPSRFASLVADGGRDTSILSEFDFPIGGTTVRQWITDRLSGSGAWV